MVNVRLIYLRVGATRLRRDHRCAVQALLDSGETIAGSWGRRASRLGVARSCGRRLRQTVRESFFKTLKSNLVDPRSWPAITKLRTVGFDDIQWPLQPTAAPLEPRLPLTSRIGTIS
jgi:hypothetical protein